MFKKRKNYSLEISIIVSLIISLAVIASINIIGNKINKLSIGFIENEITSVHELLESIIHESFIQAEIYAQVISSSNKVQDAIFNGDKKTFCKVFDTICKTVDFITVYDNSGNILLKTQEDNYCRDIKNCYIINNGLKDGSSSGISKCNHNNKLYIVSTHTIKDENNNIIALVTCGYDLTDEKYISKVKKKILCDVTVFRDDVRISTTLKDKNNNSLIGTKMSSDIAQRVLVKKENVIEPINLFGNTYITYYSPIINKDQVIGSLFVGLNIESFIKEINDTTNYVTLILVIIGFLSILIVFIINMIVLSKPVNEFNNFIEKLNLNKQEVSNKDE